MFVDKMHTAAIRDADSSGVPMTVYRGSDANITRIGYGHVLACHLADIPAELTHTTLIVSWLPANYFAA